jgi:hypothetical protein
MYTYGIKAHHVYLEVEKIVPRACFELAWLSLLARLLSNTLTSLHIGSDARLDTTA